MAWTAPRTWTAGETVTASIGNTHWRDNLKAIGDAWTTYTPTWTAVTTNPALGNGTLTGASVQAGKLTHFRILLTAGSTTTFGTGAWRFTLPVSAVSSTLVLHAGGLFTDTSATTSWPVVAARCITAATFEAMCPNSQTDTRAGLVTSATPFTWANTDVLAVSGTYEAA